MVFNFYSEIFCLQVEVHKIVTGVNYMSKYGNWYWNLKYFLEY
jgi:hypothetical protein